MGRIVGIPLGILATIALVAMCISCSAIALFLQTMFALNRQTVVADVIMYPMQSDNNGQYIEIDFTPYSYHSALVEIFNRTNPSTSELPELGRTQTYRLYGDVVAVRGPLIRLHPLLQILGFQNIYKLALLEGEYRASPGRIEGSEAVINGGFDAYWWDINDSEASYPYSLAIDRVTFSGDEEPGFSGGSPKHYQIVVTTDSITWNYIGDA